MQRLGQRKLESSAQINILPLQRVVYMATTEAPRRMNGRVNGFTAHLPPAKRPRLELVEKEAALALRKKYVAYVHTLCQKSSPCMFIKCIPHACRYAYKYLWPIWWQDA